MAELKWERSMQDNDSFRDIWYLYDGNNGIVGGVGIRLSDNRWNYAVGNMMPNPHDAINTFEKAKAFVLAAYRMGA